MINAYTVTVQLCRVTNAVTEDMLVSFCVNVKGQYFGVNTSIIRYTFKKIKIKTNSRFTYSNFNGCGDHNVNICYLEHKTMEEK